MQQKPAVHIIDDEIIAPLGWGTSANLAQIKQRQTAIKKHKISAENFYYAALFEEEKLQQNFDELSFSKAEDFTKLEKLFLLTVHHLLERNPINLEETVLIISTTKGNVELLEKAENSIPEKSKLYSLGKTIQKYFNLKNEPITLSNACISGGLGLSVGKRLLEENAYKYALVLGGDVVSKFTRSGFQLLQAMDSEVCKPYDKNRKGINLGEATAGVLLSTEKRNSTIQIVGEATANDANHISGPSRTGEGLVKAISSALNEAHLEASAIDCISAHGTATLYNDAMEAQAFGRLKLQQKPLTSYKAYYGHTFGASALIESILSIKSLQQNLLFPSLGCDEIGVEPALNIQQNLENKELKFALKTASGFGGCNFAMIFKNLKYA